MSRDIRPAAAPGASDERGSGLLDAVVASVVLLIILLPVSTLLITTGKIITTSGQRQAAAQLAQSAIDQLRDVSATSQTTPPPGTTSSTDSGLWSDSPRIQVTTSIGAPTSAGTWPSQPTLTTIVNNQTFYTWVAGGWCNYSSATSTWGNYAGTGSWAYFVAVDITWSATAPTHAPASGAGIVQIGQLPTQGTWSSYPTSNVTIAQPSVSSNGTTTYFDCPTRMS